jgi:CheY-like chemotaxis protein
VDEHGLAGTEFEWAVWACSRLHPRQYTPEYLQDFLAVRLEGPAPELARRVRRLSGEQMDALCEALRDRQAGAAAAALLVVLVVEDDASARRALARLLERDGFRVATAGHGGEALAYLHSHPPPEAIVLDLRMPVVDGRRFRELLEVEPGLAGIPVVVCSGESDAGAQADRMGAAGYFRKPVDPGELLGLVRRLCAAAAPDAGRSGSA